MPTEVFEAGEKPRAALGRLGPSETGYVVKPLVGVGAYGTRRFADAASAVDELARGDGAPCIVQPFLTSVAREGEWSFVFGGGRFTFCASAERPVKIRTTLNTAATMNPFFFMCPCNLYIAARSPAPRY